MGTAGTATTAGRETTKISMAVRVGVGLALGLSLALGLGLAACPGGPSGGAKPSVNVLAAHKEALKALPADTRWAVTLAPDHLTDQALAETDALLGLAGADRAPVRKDLSDLLTKRLGFDPSTLPTVTIFGLGSDDAGLLLPRSVKVPAKAIHVPDLQPAQRAGHTLLGSRRLLRAVDSAKGSAGEGSAKLLKGVQGEPVLVATFPAATLRDLGVGPKSQFQAQGALATISATGLQRVAVLAPAKGREALLEIFNAGVAAARAALAHAKKTLDQQDPATAAALLYADHRFDALKARFRPHEDGDFLTLDLPGGQGLGLSVLLAGVPAAIAIPAFIKYTRRAKTSEAIEELDKIYKGAAVYFMTPKIDSAGQRLPCQFPASVPPTPTPGTCCASRGGPDKDGDGRCDPNPAAWSNPTWQALSFQINDSHRFVYAFESSGVGPNAAFTASAYGDLDCDGVMSTFQRMGFADPNAPANECALTGAAAPFVENETE